MQNSNQCCTLQWHKDISSWQHLMHICYWCCENVGDYKVTTIVQEDTSLVVFEFETQQDALMFHMVWL